MNYRSTRGKDTLNLDDALRQGIAKDGGLFLPEELPEFSISSFDDAEEIHDVAETLLAPFFTGSVLQSNIREIVAETFAFPLPTVTLPGDQDNHQGVVSMLELFHGPTAAFKDVGANFLAACLSRLEGDVASPLTILVATSGDTGGAVAAAFDGRAGMRVAVLFPEGRVSKRQEHQLCCWSDNVASFKVRGSFDDCQKMVKAAMADVELRQKHRFSSANSINIGRLLPQSIYYANASLDHFKRTGRKPGFIIPTGNLGNGFACILARAMGLPIGPVIFATNANRTIGDFLETQTWNPRASVQTLASAMDVGDPSNMERLRALLGEAEALRGQIVVTSVSDEEITHAIKRDFSEFGFATCPHTATASHTYRNIEASLRAEHDWILVATAHPAKFETIVEPIVGHEIELPPELQEILERPAKSVTIEPTLAALAAAL